MSEDVHELAAAYALDAVSDEDRERFEAHLADCGTCQEEVAGFRDTAAALGAGAAESAPQRMRSRVLDAVERTPQDRVPVAREPRETGDAPAREPREVGDERARERREPEGASAREPREAGDGQAREPREAGDGQAREAGDDPAQGAASLDAARERRRRGRLDLRGSGMAAAAAAVAVFAVVAAGAVVGQRLGDGPSGGSAPIGLEDARTASLSGAEGVDARFAYDPDRDEGVLIVEGLEPVDLERNIYQLWLFHDDEPRPAGVFTTDEDGTAQVRATARVTGAELVAVTVEPPGGSSQPTAEPILAGEL